VNPQAMADQDATFRSTSECERHKHKHKHKTSSQKILHETPATHNQRPQGHTPLPVSRAPRLLLPYCTFRMRLEEEYCGFTTNSSGSSSPGLKTLQLSNVTAAFTPRYSGSDTLAGNPASRMPLVAKTSLSLWITLSYGRSVVCVNAGGGSWVVYRAKIKTEILRKCARCLRAM